jgi:hypothetical protein
MSALYVFVSNGEVYASPTRPHAPREGIPEFRNDTLSYRLRNLHVRGWVQNDCLHAIFYPIRPNFSGTLLASLEYVPKQRLSMEQSGDRYRASMWDHWQYLGFHLDQAISALRDHLFHLEGSLYRLARHVPNLDQLSDIPYDDYLPLAAAQNAAWSVKQALLQRVAVLAFLVALCDHEKEGTWWEVMSQVACDHAFMDRMRESYIVEHLFTTPRAGFFMRPDWLYREHLPFFVRANVPIYIHWGKRDCMMSIPPSLSHQYCPTPAQVSRAADVTNYQLSRFPAQRTRAAQSFAGFAPPSARPAVSGWSGAVWPQADAPDSASGSSQGITSSSTNAWGSSAGAGSSNNEPASSSAGASSWNDGLNSSWGDASASTGGWVPDSGSWPTEASGGWGEDPDDGMTFLERAQQFARQEDMRRERRAHEEAMRRERPAHHRPRRGLDASSTPAPPNVVGNRIPSSNNASNSSAGGWASESALWRTDAGGWGGDPDDGMTFLERAAQFTREEDMRRERRAHELHAHRRPRPTDRGLGASSTPVPSNVVGNTMPSDAAWKYERKKFAAGDVIPRSPGQRAGESFREFHVRRHVYREWFKKYAETHPLRQSRLSREQYAERFEIPSEKSKSGYFLWEDDVETGVYMRCLITKKRREDEWELYDAHCKRYDSVLDEWDISERFDRRPPVKLSVRSYEDSDDELDYDDGDWKGVHALYRVDDFDPPLSDEEISAASNELPPPPADTASSSHLSASDSLSPLASSSTAWEVVEPVEAPLLPSTGMAAVSQHPSREVPVEASRPISSPTGNAVPGVSMDVDPSPIELQGVYQSLLASS